MEQINKENSFGEAALFFLACKEGHIDIVKYIVEHGTI